MTAPVPGRNWEGLPGSTEHRTVGPHRARCYEDNEWCYPDPKNYCRCCDALMVPLKWRGDYVGALLADLREQVQALGHGLDCAACADMDEGIPGDTRWRETGEPCDCLRGDVLTLLDGGDDA